MTNQGIGETGKRRDARNNRDSREIRENGLRQIRGLPFPKQSTGLRQRLRGSESGRGYSRISLLLSHPLSHQHCVSTTHIQRCSRPSNKRENTRGFPRLFRNEGKEKQRMSRFEISIKEQAVLLRVISGRRSEADSSKTRLMSFHLRIPPTT